MLACQLYVSMLHSAIRTAISSEKPSCSSHLEFIFQEFPLLLSHHSGSLIEDEWQLTVNQEKQECTKYFLGF